jgi:hypothetical protein
MPVWLRTPFGATYNLADLTELNVNDQAGYPTNDQSTVEVVGKDRQNQQVVLIARYDKPLADGERIRQRCQAKVDYAMNSDRNEIVEFGKDEP